VTFSQHPPWFQPLPTPGDPCQIVFTGHCRPCSNGGTQVWCKSDPSESRGQPTIQSRVHSDPQNNSTPHKDFRLIPPNLISPPPIILLAAPHNDAAPQFHRLTPCSPSAWMHPQTCIIPRRTLTAATNCTESCSVALIKYAVGHSKPGWRQSPDSAQAPAFHPHNMAPRPWPRPTLKGMSQALDYEK
jgi:hypothetical protein